jgi:hypothetical protein
VKVIVADRSLDSVRWKLRRQLGDVREAGPAFAKWLADSARGRFLIIDNAAQSIETMLISVADEKALIEELGRRFLETFKENQKSDTDTEFVVESHTTSAVRQTLDRMVYEIRTILATGDYPLDGWKGPRDT